MIAPGTRPASARSRAGDGTRDTSSPVTTDVAIAALRRSTPVAWPVTTTASRLNTSGSSVTSAAFWSAGTATSFRLNAIRRTTSVTALAGAAIVYRPSEFVTAPNAVPVMDTLAPATASPVADLTCPVICRCCADATLAPTSVARTNAANEVRFTTKPPRTRAAKFTKGTNCTPYGAPHFGRPQEGSQGEPHGGRAPHG